MGKEFYGESILRLAIFPIGSPPPPRSRACTGFLKGPVGDTSAPRLQPQQGSGDAVPGKFLDELHAKSIGYQYGRFKAVN